MVKEVPAALSLKAQDVNLMMRAKIHLGSEKCSSSMAQYVYARRPDGVNVFNVAKTWDKLILAVRVIAAIENPSDVLVVSSRKFGQRAVLKFAANTKAQAIAGKFTPGTLTNCQAKGFKEPRLVIVTDPKADSQVIRECSFVNVPVIALCDSHTELTNIDIAIPCSTKSVFSIGTMWYLLTREVLYIRGNLARSIPWDVMPDMFFYRDLEAEKAQEAERLNVAAASSSFAQAAEAVPVVADEDGWKVHDETTSAYTGWAQLDPNPMDAKSDHGLLANEPPAVPATSWFS